MNARIIAALIAGVTAVTALIGVADRGGVIAWGALLCALALLAKVWRKPARLDLALSAGLAAVAALAWVGTWYYVIATWESGEVVELAIDTGGGVHRARVWVLDFDTQPLVYYDAEPDVAMSLLAGTPLQYTRAGETTTRIPDATRVDTLSDTEADRIFAAMAAKYQNRMGAATLYYALLGRSRDRIAVVASLVPE